MVSCWMLFGGGAARGLGLHRRGWGSDAVVRTSVAISRNGGPVVSKRAPLRGFASTPSSRARGEPRNASKRRGAVILARRGPVVAIWIGFPVRASVCRYASSKNNVQNVVITYCDKHADQLVLMCTKLYAIHAWEHIDGASGAPYR